MIQIEFQPKDISLDEDEEALLLGLSAPAVEAVYFILPVRLRANSIELFESGADDRSVFVCHVEREVFGGETRPEMSGPYVPMPVLFLAVEGLRQVRQACQGEQAKLNFPTGGSLQFRPTGDGMEISSSISGRFTHVSCSELLESFEEFAVRIRKFIIQGAPEITRHPAWLTWFDQQGAAG